jgi:hypothetical protein
MNNLIEEQKRLCRRYGANWIASPPQLKAGVARNLRGSLVPIHGMRIPRQGETTGWYLWAGDELSSDPEFFVPLHISHLDEWRPGVTRYLGLAPGWRFLYDPNTNYEDVWEDQSLLST